jgi:DNA-binding MarR family transcriptional regulator
MGGGTKKQQLIEALGDEFRLSGLNDAAMDHVAAARMGVNRTDLACLDAISRTGPLTAGEIARQIGLTTGAVTAVIDRLEHAGYARRVRDEGDRRKVMVEATPKMYEEAAGIWGPLATEWQEVISRYTAGEIELLLKLMRAGNEIERRHIERIRDELEDAD